MWNLLFVAYITTAVYAQQQNSRRPEPQDNGHGWDIRLAVPGEPGGDYPTLNAIPRTSFSCSRKSPGYYADMETGCQVFRVCTLGSTYGFQSFLCPNGTLFNQEVFVCDWWMNVKCDRSQQLFNDNREKFGNLKLGPQLMKDIKKMLTHPMRNPYDRSIMKNNLIVMQEYKPPSGQLFPNGALISGPERPPNNIYVPAKQRQGNFAQNSFFSEDLSYAASTPSSQYIPSSFNTFGPSRDVDVIQQQRQSIPNTNSHAGLTNNNRSPQSTYIHGQNHNPRNLQPSSQNVQNGQLQHQLLQRSNFINLHNQIKQSDNKRISIPTQQFSVTPKQNGQLVQKNNIHLSSNEVNLGSHAKQNLVRSNSVQPTGKTLKFSRIVQKSTSGNPKSRITFKTWIVRPSKTARLVAEPTPYTYNRPSNASTENRLVETTGYEQNPTTEKFNSESENVPYVYNKPTTSSKQIIAIEETPLVYLPPTVPTLPNQIYSTLKTPQSSKQQSHLNLPPTTYKPASRLYVPPSENSLKLSRQYLSPNEQSPETVNYQSARLIVTPTSPSVDFTTPVLKSKNTPSFSLTKQSHINTNHNNLTFADILTKEKLDITVNDIVRNTDQILKTASPNELNRYRQNQENANNPESNYLSHEFDNDIDEKLTSQPPRSLHKNEKLVATPSTELEPPISLSNDDYDNSNKLLNLPFFKEPAVPKNIIERTVSLKITIPETVADYLFKNHTQTNPDKLEILNTGSSNYLVLTNNDLDDNNGVGFIPIGKIIWDENVNISNSQALVYSFLADSINAAKEYSNIAIQNLVSPTSTQQTNINNEDIGDISDKVSRLTASQFTKGNPNNGVYVVSPTHNGQYRDNNRHVTELSSQSPSNHPLASKFSEQNLPDRLYSSRLQRLSNNNNNNIDNLQRNMEQIYSGQLYQLSVPEVTSKIYNSPNLLQTHQIRQTNELSRESHRDVNKNNIKKQPDTDVEILQPETLPSPPVRQQLPRTGESTTRFHNIQDKYENIFADNFLNSDNAITAQVQDKITGSLPHPLEENKLVTYQKNKSYYLYTKLDDDNNGNNDNTETTNTITQTNERGNLQNAKLIRSNDLANRVTFELFPAIGYELEDEREKQQILNSFKISDFSDSANTGKIESFNQRQDNLVTGVDFTILHPSSKKQVEQRNNENTILYRGPSSYLAPQSSVGSIGNTQQTKNYARIEQFEDNNGYSKTIPARQFSF